MFNLVNGFDSAFNFRVIKKVCAALLAGNVQLSFEKVIIFEIIKARKICCARLGLELDLDLDKVQI